MTSHRRIQERAKQRNQNREIRKKLAEAKSSPSTIEEWQKRVVRLDKNQRQSKIEEQILGRNTMYPQGNSQPRGEFGRGSYRRREGQIMQRLEDQYRGGYQNRGGQPGPIRDPNTMEVNRGRGGNRMYFIYGKQGHMANNC